jgi:formylglycine-generating enzyme required for sulfatase activity
MSEDAVKKVRVLTDDYFSGLMDRQDYVRARGEILDALIGLPPGNGDDTTQTDPVGPSTENDEPQIDTERPLPKVEPATPVEPPRSEEPAGGFQQYRNHIIAGGVAFVMMIAVAVSLLGGNDPGSEAETVTGPPPSADPAPTFIEESMVVQEPAATTETDRVRQFLESPIWDESVVSGFVFDWDLLSTADREDFRSSELFIQFVTHVRDRIKIDNALDSERLDSGLSLAEALAVELELGLDVGEPAPMEAPVAEVESTVADSTALELIPEDPPKEPASEEAAPVVVAEQSGIVPVESEPVEEVADSSPASTPRFESDRPCTVDRLNYRSATCWDMLAAEIRAPVVRVIAAGEFSMGQADDPMASPVHRQVIERPFAIGTHEISVAEFERYCAAAGVTCPERRWSSGQYPIVDVTWAQAVAYTNWLTEATGATYRLPTEAEWEYAARAGTTDLYPFGESVSPAYARFDTGLRTLSPLPNDDRTTRYNGFRLWHLAGNVREWTVDVWRGRYDGDGDPGMRTVRGGSYAEPADRLRSAARTGESVDYFDTKTGFRVVRELD